MFIRRLPLSGLVRRIPCDHPALADRIRMAGRAGLREGRQSSTPIHPSAYCHRIDRNSSFAPKLTEREVAMKYKIVMHRTDEGISVSVPALPGCWSEGDTEEEALANIQDAIREYLAALEDRFRDAEVREVEVQM